MAQYISKDALVAEIERKIDKLYDLLPDASKVENGSTTISEVCNIGKYTALESFRRFVNTLEVKEVDLETEIIKWEESFGHCHASMGYKETAKHFFELGIAVSNKAQKGE